MMYFMRLITVIPIVEAYGDAAQHFGYNLRYIVALVIGTIALWLRDELVARETRAKVAL